MSFRLFQLAGQGFAIDAEDRGGLSTMASWLALEQIKVTRRGDLAKQLRSMRMY
ncbi:MAG TPA: hypothetical protein VN916_05350 [Candidatus Acidoferrum sp.]|nr:hypothetical protein [Candidatus Acidoferrum sp.]